MSSVRVELFKVRDYSLPTKIEGLIEFLRDELDKIPQKYRSTTDVEFDYDAGYGEDRYYFLTASYYRPETKQEAQERLAKNKQKSQARLEQERAQYLKLKEKFG